MILDGLSGPGDNRTGVRNFGRCLNSFVHFPPGEEKIELSVRFNAIYWLSGRPLLWLTSVQKIFSPGLYSLKDVFADQACKNIYNERGVIKLQNCVILCVRHCVRRWQLRAMILVLSSVWSSQSQA